MNITNIFTQLHFFSFREQYGLSEVSNHLEYAGRGDMHLNDDNGILELQYVLFILKF